MFVRRYDKHDKIDIRRSLLLLGLFTWRCCSSYCCVSVRPSSLLLTADLVCKKLLCAYNVINMQMFYNNRINCFFKLFTVRIFFTIRAIFTTDRCPVAGVHIMHVKYKKSIRIADNQLSTSF